MYFTLHMPKMCVGFCKRMVITTLMVLLCVTFTRAQFYNDVGGKVGLSFQIGTHVNRVGIMYQVYYYKNFVQLTQSGYYYFNLKNLGPKGQGFESQFQIGALLYWGKKLDKRRYLFSDWSKMGDKAYAFGYSYKYYDDQIKTTQSTGAFILHTYDFELVVENDFFGSSGNDDKYRTGAVTLSYSFDSLKVSLQNTQWTGKSVDGRRFRDKKYPSRFGYRDLRNALYGRLSHGILALRVDYQLNDFQTIRVETGVDAEQVRNIFQNKLVHDLLPAKLMNYENPHYPMLQEDGTPYLYEKDKKVRAPKVYLHFGVNQPVFY